MDRVEEEGVIEQLSKKINVEAVELGYTLSTIELKQLAKHLVLLDKWNKVHNLTALKTIKEMIQLHVIDSLSVNNFLIGNKILDVGTGAGFPGIPLAILNPDKQFYLLDSSYKKNSFLQELIFVLGVTNVNLVCSRVEDFVFIEGFSSILSRAFASLVDFTSKTSHLCAKDGVFLAMKGNLPIDEIKELRADFSVLGIQELKVSAGIEARNLIIIKKSK